MGSRRSRPKFRRSTRSTATFEHRGHQGTDQPRAAKIQRRPERLTAVRYARRWPRLDRRRRRQEPSRTAATAAPRAGCRSRSRPQPRRRRSPVEQQCPAIGALDAICASRRARPPRRGVRQARGIHVHLAAREPPHPASVRTCVRRTPAMRTEYPRCARRAVPRPSIPERGRPSPPRESLRARLRAPPASSRGLTRG